MTTETEIARCVRREAEELHAAERALTDAARDAHFAMAERYADRVWSLREAQANPLDLVGPDDLILKNDWKIETYATALEESHGDDALRVALAQQSAADEEGASTWTSIVEHLTRRNGERSPS